MARQRRIASCARGVTAAAIRLRAEAALGTRRSRSASSTCRAVPSSPGRGFPLFTGRGARLVRALANFMLDLHTREHGYLEV